MGRGGREVCICAVCVGGVGGGESERYVCVGGVVCVCVCGVVFCYRTLIPVNLATDEI